MAVVRDFVPLHANIAHRGTTYWAPEETEASWRWARHIGADYLEGDLQCSKDGIVLVVHDNSFSRTTDIRDVFGSSVPGTRRDFYRSFKNPDGSQHFSESDIEEQVAYDVELGVGLNARDYYYAELLMLDAGKWFNEKYLERARIGFSGTQCVSTLSDMIAFASGKMLKRGGDGKRILKYSIKSEFTGMTLRQIRQRSENERGTILNGEHFSADARYMDFIHYDFDDAYTDDPADNGNRPGIYIEFKESSLQPADIEARAFLVLDSTGWNIITSPSSDKEFYRDGLVNTGNTNGKVVLQTFRLEAVERVEKIFKGQLPMCYLIDDEPPTDWDPDNYFDDPFNAAKVIDYAIAHKCHIIGPSVDGEPNNYPNRYNSWQVTLVRRSGMLNHPWSIDSNSQCKTTMDGMFTNRSDMTLQWLIDNGLRDRTSPKVEDPESVLDALGYHNMQ